MKPTKDSFAVVFLTSLVISLSITTFDLLAGNSTLSYTTQQSTRIQSKLIPRYNARHCAQFGLPASCSTGDLATAGCAPTVQRTLTTDSCTIFASSAAGEQAFLQEVANQGLIAVFNDIVAEDSAAYMAAECARWKALTPTQQDTECTTRGRGPGCFACP